MTRMSGAELTIRLLERQGLTCLAGIPGGFNLPLYDALFHSRQIRHVLARHEQGAGFIAGGLARSSGETEVFFATSGPGATNALTTLADAKLDSVPVVCITGQAPRSLLGTDSFQEVDTYGMSLPVTKHNFLVRRLAELPEIIPEAFRIAAGGRPGPVLIDLPKDIQSEVIDISSLPPPGRPAPPAGPNPDQTARAADLINQSRRPLFLFGGGAARPETAEIALELVESGHIPAAMTMMGLGVIPVEHALSLGMIGMHGARCANLLLAECDLLIVVGARFGDRATGRLNSFCPEAQVIHIDIDAGEIGKLRSANIGLEAEAGLALAALKPLLHKERREGWLARVSILKKSHPLIMDGARDPTTAYGIIRRTAELLGNEAIITSDVGQHQMRVAQAYPFRRPRQWLTSGGLGCMGFGLPTAIGAALKHPRVPVVCFSGDGSFLMNIQELATAVDERVNVKIVLCNNQGLGLVQQQQELFFDGRLIASRYGVELDYGQITAGFGLPSVNLTRAADPLTALKTALEADGPYLIQVDLKAEDKVYPMVPPGAANTEMIGGELCVN